MTRPDVEGIERETRPAVMAAWVATLIAYIHEVERERDGAVRSWERRIQESRDKNAEIVRLAGVADEMTDKWLLDREPEEQRKRAEKADAAADAAFRDLQTAKGHIKALLEKHDDHNTHRFCLNGADKDGGVFDLQVNRSDLGWMHWVFDALDERSTSWLSQRTTLASSDTPTNEVPSIDPCDLVAYAMESMARCDHIGDGYRCVWVLGHGGTVHQLSVFSAAEEHVIHVPPDTPKPCERCGGTTVTYDELTSHGYAARPYPACHGSGKATSGGRA